MQIKRRWYEQGGQRLHQSRQCGPLGQGVFGAAADVEHHQATPSDGLKRMAGLPLQAFGREAQRNWRARPGDAQSGQGHEIALGVVHRMGQSVQALVGAAGRCAQVIKKAPQRKLGNA
jgi:hypothetical protein